MMAWSLRHSFLIFYSFNDTHVINIMALCKQEKEHKEGTNTPTHIGPTYTHVYIGLRGVPRIFGGGGVQGRTQDFRRGGGGVPRSAKEANKPNKRSTELKPRTCTHHRSMFRPY